MRLLLLYLFYLTALQCNAQMTIPGKPVETDINIEPIILDTFKIDINNITSKNKLIKNTIPTGEISLNLTPLNCGVWLKIDGIKIWKVCFKYTNAEKLSILFNEFKINENIKVFVYNQNKSQIIGALSSLNNKSSGILPMSFIKGDEIFIEMQIPENIRDYGKILLGKIFIIFQPSSSKNRNKEPCYNDISCYNNPIISETKDGICKINIYGAINCTGTLINNTRNDGTPYILTANHCISSQTDADFSVFTFNYEHYQCDCEAIKSIKSISGAELIATNEKYDFSLLKLSVIPDSSYNPCYIGWDVSGSSYSEVTCLHQMNGGAKSISFEYDLINKETFNNVVDYFAENAHWKVTEWDIGSTQGGSSGAPLLSSEGKIIGVLSGGEADCLYPNNDFFADIKMGWETDFDSTRQLKYWLDPNGQNPISIGTYRPHNPFIDNERNFCPQNSISENKNQTHKIIRLVPNTKNNSIIISSDFDIPKNLKIEIYNLIGQLVWNDLFYLYPGENYIKLNNMTNGIYIMKIAEPNLTFKFILN